MKHTAKRVGDQYFIYDTTGEPIAILNSLEAFLDTAKLLSVDPADDGPEVDIIRAVRIAECDDFNGTLKVPHN